MEKKQYIIPEAEMFTIYAENILNKASGENYNTRLGSWDDDDVEGES